MEKGVGAMEKRIVPLGERNRRTGRLMAIGVLFLLVFGLYFGAHHFREERQPAVQVLEEVVLTDWKPYRFQEDRLFFRGRIGEKTEYFIFDLRTGILHREDWSKRYGDDRFSHHLGRHGRLVAERAEDGSGLTLFLERGGRRIRIADGLPTSVRQPVSLAPDKEAFVYAVAGIRGVGVKLYRLETGQSFFLVRDVPPEKVNRSGFVRWSADGTHLLLDDRSIFRQKDGKRVGLLDGTGGAWSPGGLVVAYLDVSEKRLMLFDVVSGKRRVLYEAEEGERIVRWPVWDPSGRYFAFATGRRERGETIYEKVHVMDGQLFHYVENEQNLMPTRLENVMLSPGGDYLSYVMDGILKLVNLRTQESRVYDVYVQEEYDQLPYIRYDGGGVWLAQDHQVLYIDERMEETEIHRTGHPLLGLYLSSKKNNMLVIEEFPEGYGLRLVKVNLPEASGDG